MDNFIKYLEDEFQRNLVNAGKQAVAGLGAYTDVEPLKKGFMSKVTNDTLTITTTVSSTLQPLARKVMEHYWAKKQDDIMKIIMGG